MNSGGGRNKVRPDGTELGEGGVNERLSAIASSICDSPSSTDDGGSIHSL